MSVNSHNQEAAKTREQVKKDKQAHEEKPRAGRIRIRLIPIWLRIIIVALLIVISTIAGAAVGYSVMGDGEVKDIFQKSTWTHIFDLVEKE